MRIAPQTTYHFDQDQERPHRICITADFNLKFTEEEFQNLIEASGYERTDSSRIAESLERMNETLDRLSAVQGLVIREQQKEIQSLREALASYTDPQSWKAGPEGWVWDHSVNQTPWDLRDLLPLDELMDRSP